METEVSVSVPCSCTDEMGCTRCEGETYFTTEVQTSDIDVPTRIAVDLHRRGLITASALSDGLNLEQLYGMIGETL